MIKIYEVAEASRMANKVRRETRGTNPVAEIARMLASRATKATVGAMKTPHLN